MNPEEKKLLNLSVHESSDPEMLKRNAESKTETELGKSAPDEDNSEVIEPESDAIYDEQTVERSFNVAAPNAAAVKSGITEI